MNDERWLVLFDTDHIKQYLFATNKLKEIRGASRLLVRLNTELTEQTALEVCPSADKVYADGGGALFLVPSETDARRAVAAVEKLYREQTLSASITGACLPLAPATEQQGFGQRVWELGHLLRRAKAWKAEQPGLSVVPYLHLCDACGQHPAMHRQTDEEGLPQLLCRACRAKRAYAPGSRRDEPEDFNQLGALSSPAGYLGFIYADGNLVGKWLGELATRDAYAHFAMELPDLMRTALAHALGGLLREGRKPYIELLLGGDDLLLVTTVDLALSVALTLAQKFEAGSSAVLQSVGLSGQLTLAVGVVLAHVGYPIAELNRLAEERLRSAKRCSFKSGYKTGAIDFEVVTSAVGQTDESTPYTNRRPYTLKEMEELLTHVQKMRTFPTSQLQSMYESLYVSHETATLASLLALARAPRKRWKTLRDFFIWSGSLRDNCLPPWCEPDETVTALGDLVELLPFTERSQP